MSRNNHQDDAQHGAGYCRTRMHRTWFFWCFVLIPVIVALGWTQYMSQKGPYGAMPWLGISEIHYPVHWGDWIRYYIWLQLVWLPANMVFFLIWCALGVRLWNCKKKSIAVND